MLAPVDAAALRARFPVLERLAYLNAGTDGPVPDAAVAAADGELQREVRDGRFKAHFERRFELAGRLRAAYAALVGAAVEDVALTSSTSEGLATVVAGLDLGRGDQILTSDEEHPGLHGPLIAARRTRGVTVRAVPFRELADAVSPATRLVATSHVSWATGALAPAALADLDVPVLLDGAQGIGAVPVEVGALGCAAYAGSGQKWMCGPDGTGMLYVAPWFRERVTPTGPSYVNLADPGAGLDAEVHPDARRYDAGAIGAVATASALAAHDVLAEAGWDAVFSRSAGLAARLADALREAGRSVAPRDATTLVSFSSADAEAERDRLLDAGIVIRDLPGRGMLRASVGAWNDESDLERLLTALD